MFGSKPTSTTTLLEQAVRNGTEPDYEGRDRKERFKTFSHPVSGLPTVKRFYKMTDRGPVWIDDNSPVTQP